ncbi:A/G-specific adenine glycosylase [Arenibacter latericius]|uniref:A/G-specific adenine glycosylase n=1 Tax=Arenibacter latericius TaxID=86104 RepID=UPI00047C4E8F|nr:A/G-specific adenine glycosylase [Arenibacter latericius]
MSFSRIILEWYSLYKRPLPWRKTRDPYLIWLSEIMLQQTRVAQGIPYYLTFVKKFPTVHHLANAKEEQVLKLWQGLGYYSRARNLHATAKYISEECNGIFPNTYKELIKLKGVGDYTASAIASICFDRPEAVVDGNVYRVLARYYGVSLPINAKEGVAYFRELANKVMDVHNIKDYNQGIMEFGALQCTPKKPNCNSCPFSESCVALATDTIGELPVKIKKNKVRKRYFNYLVVVDENNSTLLQQRIGPGIWQNLYQFPLLETDNAVEVEEVSKGLKEVVGVEEPSEVYLYNKDQVIHKLSHQHLHTRFWIVHAAETLKDGIKINDLHKYPVPVLIADFIKAFKI